MRRLMLVLALGACGGSTMVPDAGPTVDTTCGIDCDSQRAFGLLVGSCFEYSASMNLASPPDLAAEVQPLVMLEGGVPVLQVQYSTGGQHSMKDSFTIASGTLKLVRREWSPSGSVSYQNPDNSLDGVKWLSADVSAASNQSTTENARFILGSTDKTESTMYRVTASAPSLTDLETPSGVVDGGVLLLFGEDPDHGSDSRRVFAAGLGFTLITSTLSPPGGASQEYRLQNVKNTADAGTACGFQ